MPWFTVDDGFSTHPKVILLRSMEGWEGALALWTLAGSWSAGHLTEGAVPFYVVPSLGGSERSASLLVSVGLWSKRKNDFVFNGWLKRNPSKDDVEKKRKENADRQAAFREKEKARRNAVSNALRNDPVTRSHPIPSHPIPDQKDLRADALPLPELPVVSIAAAPDNTPDRRTSDSGPPPGEPERRQSPAEQIRELSARYDSKLAADVRAACALSRRGGKVSDPKWAQVLQVCAAHPLDAVQRAMSIFVERYSDGEKDERYFLGIVRGEVRTAQRAGSGTRQGPLRPATAAEFTTAAKTDEEFDAQMRAAFGDRWDRTASK